MAFDTKKYLDQNGLTHLWDKIEAELANRDTATSNLEALVGTLPEGATAQTVVDYAKEVADAAAGDASQVAADLATEVERAKAAEKENADAIAAHKTLVDNAVSTLVGEDRNKSVRTIAGEETAKIVDSAPEAFDTLKEIAAWIGTGDVENTTAAEILTKVKANETAIGIEKTRAEGIESGLQAAIDAINNEDSGILKSAKDYADGLDSAMDARVDSLEAAIGENGSVATQIKGAIEALDATISQSAGTDGLALSVVEEDGKITSISGSIAAQTYDAYGEANAVYNAIIALTAEEIDAAIAESKNKA